MDDKKNDFFDFISEDEVVDNNEENNIDLTYIDDEGIFFSYEYEREGVKYLDNILVTRCGHKIYRERIENGSKRIYLKSGLYAFNDSKLFNNIKEKVNESINEEASESDYILFSNVKLRLPLNPGDYYQDDYLYYIDMKYMSELDKFAFTKIDFSGSLKSLFLEMNEDLNYGIHKEVDNNNPFADDNKNSDDDFPF